MKAMDSKLSLGMIILLFIQKKKKNLWIFSYEGGYDLLAQTMLTSMSHECVCKTETPSSSAVKTVVSLLLSLCFK